MDGILLVNKPKDWTSQDVVSKIKRILHVNKAGHAGTLDPLATGVLVVLLGSATKLSNYLLEKDKTYLSEITLGIKTDTDDIYGNIINMKDVNVSSDTIDSILKSFIGVIDQVPPMYSAIKQNGKKLYELARKGVTVDRASRSIQIFDIKRVNQPIHIDNTIKFKFTAHVSKGTYIRTLCSDIGEKLHTYACLSSLTRLKAGDFLLEDCYDIVNIESGNYKILNMLDVLNEYKRIELTDNEYKYAINGRNLSFNTNEEILVLAYNNQLVAIYKKTENGNEYKAERVWN